MFSRIHNFELENQARLRGEILILEKRVME